MLYDPSCLPCLPKAPADLSGTSTTQIEGTAILKFCMLPKTPRFQLLLEDTLSEKHGYSQVLTAELCVKLLHRKPLDICTTNAKKTHQTNHSINYSNFLLKIIPFEKIFQCD